MTIKIILILNKTKYVCFSFEIPEIGTIIIDAIMSCIECSRLIHTMVFLIYYNGEIKIIYIDGHIVLNNNLIKIFHAIVHKFK